MTGNQLAECSGKYTYATYWSAVRAAKKLNRSHEKSKANSYRCTYCHNWHVGNTIKQKRNDRI